MDNSIANAAIIRKELYQWMSEREWFTEAEICSYAYSLPIFHCGTNKIVSEILNSEYVKQFGDCYALDTIKMQPEYYAILDSVTGRYWSDASFDSSVRIATIFASEKDANKVIGRYGNNHNMKTVKVKLVIEET